MFRYLKNNTKKKKKNAPKKEKEAVKIPTQHKQDGENHLQRLPDELMVEIISYLNHPRDITFFGLTSKANRVYSEEKWRQKLKQDFGVETNNQEQHASQRYRLFKEVSHPETNVAAYEKFQTHLSKQQGNTHHIMGLGSLALTETQAHANDPFIITLKDMKASVFLASKEQRAVETQHFKRSSVFLIGTDLTNTDYQAWYEEVNRFTKKTAFIQLVVTLPANKEIDWEALRHLKNFLNAHQLPPVLLVNGKNNTAQDKMNLCQQIMETVTNHIEKDNKRFLSI